jgi:hypothetical protein
VSYDDGVAIDWALRIADARAEGVDLMATMSEADWEEYRQECRAVRAAAEQDPVGQAHAQRRAASIARQMAEHEAAS